LSSGSWFVPVAACCCGGGGAGELADLGPGEFLVACVVDGLGQELLGLGDEAGQGVQPGGGVAGPVGGAQPGEGVDRVGEDLEAVVAGGGGGLLAGAGQAQWRVVLPGTEDADEGVAGGADVKAPLGCPGRGFRRLGVAVIGEVSLCSFVEEFVDGGSGCGFVDDRFVRGECRDE
jgi:hypothetical protein